MAGVAPEVKNAPCPIHALHSQPFRQMGVVNPIPQVEVQQVEAVAGLAHNDQRAHAECRRQPILPGQAQNDAAEEGHQQAVVEEDVGNQRP